MHPNLDSISISKAKNGFSVKHNYKPKPTYKRGNKDGGFGVQYNAPEEHVFGAGDGEKLLSHVGKALGLQGKTDAQAETRGGRGQGGFSSQAQD